MANVVTLRGKLGRSEVLDTLSRANLFVNPTQHDGWGCHVGGHSSSGSTIVSRLRGVTTALGGRRNAFAESWLAQSFLLGLCPVQHHWPAELRPRETKVFSQSGEDGIIGAIFETIGVTNRFFVEFGATPAGNNSDNLAKGGWTGVLMGIRSGPPGIAGIAAALKQAGNGLINRRSFRSVFQRAIKERKIRHEFVTAENINQLFERYGVPRHFDFLSIDIDGNDYWVWKAIDDQRFRPRAVCIEFNAHFKETQSFTIRYNPKHRYARNKYYGASLLALKRLGESRGYKLVYVTGCFNAFFVSEELLTNVALSKNVSDYFTYPVDVRAYYTKWGLPRMPTWYDSVGPFELEKIHEEYDWVEV